MNQSDKREQQIRLAALEENFPNRPAECTRRRMKPYMDACDCAWCRRVNEAWEQAYGRQDDASLS